MPLKLDDVQLKCGPDTTGLPIRFEHVGAATVRDLQSLEQPILGFPDRMKIALMDDPTPVINQVRDPCIDVTTNMVNIWSRHAACAQSPNGVSSVSRFIAEPDNLAFSALVAGNI